MYMKGFVLLEQREIHFGHFGNIRSLVAPALPYKDFFSMENQEVKTDVLQNHSKCNSLHEYR